MGLDVTIRPAREDEHALIYSAWINTQKSCKARALMHPKKHDEGLHRLIGRVLSRKTTAVYVAEYEGIVAGFLVCEPAQDLVHYAFTKEPYRRQGVMHELMTSALIGPIESWRAPADPPVRYTHKPEEHRNIPIPSSWVYDPFAAWAPE